MSAGLTSAGLRSAMMLTSTPQTALQTSSVRPRSMVDASHALRAPCDAQVQTELANQARKIEQSNTLAVQRRQELAVNLALVPGRHVIRDAVRMQNAPAAIRPHRRRP